MRVSCTTTAIMRILRWHSIIPPRHSTPSSPSTSRRRFPSRQGVVRDDSGYPSSSDASLSYPRRHTRDAIPMPSSTCPTLHYKAPSAFRSSLPHRLFHSPKWPHPHPRCDSRPASTSMTFGPESQYTGPEAGTRRCDASSYCRPPQISATVDVFCGPSNNLRHFSPLIKFSTSSFQASKSSRSDQPTSRPPSTGMSLLATVAATLAAEGKL